MATPENRIVRRAAARLATDIDHTLPEQVQHLLAGQDTHAWATGKRFGADQSVVVTIAGYLIGATHAAWALCVDPASPVHRFPTEPEGTAVAQAILDKHIRAVVAAPESIPGYVRDEVIAACIEETLAEAGRHEPRA